MKNLKNIPQHTVETPSTRLATQLYFAPIIASLFFILTTTPALAADDDYLRSLESEASSSAPSKKASAGDNYLDALSAEAESSAHVTTDTSNVKSAEEQAALENFLQKEKPTTFKYYKKLGQQDKKKIVGYYRSDNSDKSTKLSHLRKIILDLYFKR